MSLVSLTDVVKTFGETVAVDSATFSIDRVRSRRLPRAQRRGQDDDHAASHAVPRTRWGHDLDRWPVHRGPPGRTAAPHRLPARDEPPVPGHARRRVHHVHGPAARDERRRDPRADRRCRRADRHRSRLLPPHQPALEGVPAARRPRAGHPLAAGDPHPRRTDRGTRPEPARRRSAASSATWGATAPSS